MAEKRIECPPGEECGRIAIRFLAQGGKDELVERFQGSNHIACQNRSHRSVVPSRLRFNLSVASRRDVL